MAISEPSQFEELVVAEYRYWRSHEPNNQDQAAVQMGAMGAASNLLGAINGHPAPWHLNQPGDTNKIFPAEVCVWGKKFVYLIRFRLFFGDRAWRTFWHVVVWKFSFGMSFPAFFYPSHWQEKRRNRKAKP